MSHLPHKLICPDGSTYEISQDDCFAIIIQTSPTYREIVYRELNEKEILKTFYGNSGTNWIRIKVSPKGHQMISGIKITNVCLMAICMSGYKIIKNKERHSQNSERHLDSFSPSNQRKTVPSSFGVDGRIRCRTASVTLHHHHGIGIDVKLISEC